MASERTELYREVKVLRRDVEEIKGMLIPEILPTGAERQAIAKGRKPPRARRRSGAK